MQKSDVKQGILHALTDDGDVSPDIPVDDVWRCDPQLVLVDQVDQFFRVTYRFAMWIVDEDWIGNVLTQ